MDNFDKKNSEGYSDPTPYQAIKGMIKPGEVWEIRDKNSEKAEVLVIAVNDDVCNIVYLRDEYKSDCFECVGSGLKWFNPRMLNWTWAKFMTKRVRKLDIKEFAAISMEIEKVLAVKISREAFITVNPNEVDALKKELDAMHCRAKEADSMAIQYATECTEALDKCKKLEVQLEMLKGMYSDLMDKFLQKV